MDIRHLRYFLAIAQCGQFTRAAAQLSIAQPALSQQIKQLEKELGLLLFERQGRRVQLTGPGEAFLLRAQKIVSEVDNLGAEMRDFSAEVRGRVGLGSMLTLSLGPLNLPALLADFHARFPKIQIMLRESGSDGLSDMLRSGEVDLALLDTSLVTGLSEFEVEPITTEEMVVLVSPNHRLARVGVAPLAEFAGEDFIRLSYGSSSRMDIISHSCAAAGFTPNFTFDSANVHVARALVSAGLAVHVTHRWVAESDGPPVAIVRLDPAVFHCSIGLIWRKSQYQPAAVAQFLTFAWDRLHFRSYYPGLVAETG